MAGGVLKFSVSLSSVGSQGGRGSIERNEFNS